MVPYINGRNFIHLAAPVPPSTVDIISCVHWIISPLHSKWETHHLAFATRPRVALNISYGAGGELSSIKYTPPGANARQKRY